MKKQLSVILIISILAMMVYSCHSRPENESQTVQSGDLNGKDDGGDKRVVSVKRPIDYGEKHEARTFMGMEVAESELYVKAIEGINDDSFRGVDVSTYIVQKDSGVKYYDFSGNELDDAGFFNFLADCGINWVRIRVWNDPYNDKGQGYGGGNNDIEKAIAIGKLATNAGMRVLIDFHYSDFWADPNNQRAPKAWADKTFDEKKKLIFEFTKESLEKLLESNVDVGMVQIGNEINNGLAGEKIESRIFELLKLASEAVRTVDKEEQKNNNHNNENIKIGVHYTDPQNTTFPEYARKLIEAGVDYDVFMASYYPFWHGNLGMLSMNLKTVIDSYGKDVMVVETSYLYTDKDSDGHPNSVSKENGIDGVVLDYEISPQGQADAIRDVLETVIKLGDKGLGVCYWEPAWITVKPYDIKDVESGKAFKENQSIWKEQGSGWASGYAGSYDGDNAGKYYGGSSWDNQAMFDSYGKPLPSLNVFKYVFSGTTAKSGNYIKNNGFEEHDMSCWNMEGSVKRQEGNDMKSGVGCLHFWNDREVDYTVTQNIKDIPAGTYELKAYLQGGDAGVNDEFTLFIEITTEEYSKEYSENLSVSGWQKWQKGIVSDIIIPEGADVIVGVRGNASAGAWGAWDDFSLRLVQE